MKTKVNGTFYNNKIVLDTPVEYASILVAPKKSTFNHGARYEFELSVVDGLKPEVIGGVVIKEIPSKASIVLDGSMITTYSNEQRAKIVASKVLSENLEIDFSTSRTKFIEPSINDGEVIVKSFNNFHEAIEMLQKLNNEEISLFSLSFGDTVSDASYSSQSKLGEFVGNFYLQSDLVPLLDVFQMAFDANEVFSFLLTGEAGYGKTSAYKAIAQHLGKDFLYIDCSVMLNTTDWFGIMQAKDGDTYFETTPFTDALERGNVVIILDEFNRLSIDVANSLLPIMDDRKSINVRNRQINVAGGIMFGITLNEGIEYTGIGGIIDKAIKSRIIGKVEIIPLPSKIEQKIIKNYQPSLDDEAATKIVKIMNSFRDTITKAQENGSYVTADVSTRKSKQISWLVSKGIDIRTALDYTIFNFANSDERVILMDALGIAGVL